MLKQRRNYFTLSLDARKFICVLSETAKSTSPSTPDPQVKVTLVTVRKLTLFQSIKYTTKAQHNTFRIIYK